MSDYLPLLRSEYLPRVGDALLRRVADDLTRSLMSPSGKRKRETNTIPTALDFHNHICTAWRMAMQWHTEDGKGIPLAAAILLQRAADAATGDDEELQMARTDLGARPLHEDLTMLGMMRDDLLSLHPLKWPDDPRRRGLWRLVEHDLVSCPLRVNSSNNALVLLYVCDDPLGAYAMRPILRPKDKSMGYGKGRIDSFQFCPNGKYLLFVNVCTITVSDISTGKDFMHINPYVDGSYRGFCFSRDSKMLAFYILHEVFLYDIGTGDRLVRHYCDREITSIALSQCGNHITIDHQHGGNVFIETNRRHPPVDIPYAQYLISSTSENRGIVVRNRRNAQLIRIMKPMYHMKPVSIEHELGVYVAHAKKAPYTSGYEQVFVTHIPPYLLMVQEHCHLDVITATALSRDGRYVASGSRDDTVRTWLAATGTQLAVMKGHKQGITCVGFSSDGNRVVSTGSDMTARIWDTLSGHELLRVIFRDRSLTAAFTHDDSAIGVSMNWPPFVYEYDSHTAQVRGKRLLERWPEKIIYTPGGHFLVVQYPQSFQVWPLGSSDYTFSVEGVAVDQFEGDYHMRYDNPDPRWLNLETGESTAWTADITLPTVKSYDKRLWLESPRGKPIWSRPREITI